MNYTPPPQKPDMPTMNAPSVLEQALGDRQKINQIKTRMNASYPAKQPERKKAFSSSPRTIDI